MNAYLFRQHYKTHTFGILVAGGEVFRTLEPPWLDNKPNISCIPAGVYDTSYLPRSGSGKYRQVWHVKEVPGRSGVLVHNGNLVAHTKGCILVGTKHGRLGGQPAVLASRTGMRKLREAIGERGFTLTIFGDV